MFWLRFSAVDSIAPKLQGAKESTIMTVFYLNYNTKFSAPLAPKPSKFNLVNKSHLGALFLIETKNRVQPYIISR